MPSSGSASEVNSKIELHAWRVLACGGEVDGERVHRRLPDHGVQRHEVLEHAAVGGIHGGPDQPSLDDERTDRRTKGSTK